MPLYPLKFEPIYKDKVWGGQSFKTQLGRELPTDNAIGEAWELVDLGSTSVSGGGGQAERSVISNGPLAGKTLNELIGEYRDDVMGTLQLNEFGNFPLLVKFLDANGNLSVQVHPSQAYADAHEDAHLKSECWYILHAEPGAKIYRGIKAGTTPEVFQKAIEENQVEEYMISVEVKPGEMYYLPSGTCHALGEGILVAEVQTPSDTTFRVYDWGRTDRELHIEQAMQCIDFHPADTSAYDLDTTIENDQGFQIRGLVSCEYFCVHEQRASQAFSTELSQQRPVVWMVLDGGGVVNSHGLCEEVGFTAGETLLLPAQMCEAKVSFEPGTRLLEVTFPQIEGQLIA